MWRERVTTLIDSVALLAIAAGISGIFWPRFDFGALIPGGVFLLISSTASAALHRRDNPPPEGDEVP